MWRAAHAVLSGAAAARKEIIGPVGASKFDWPSPRSIGFQPVRPLGWFAARCPMRRLVLLLVLFLASSAFAEARKPNIIVIVGDDMGYADIGVQDRKSTR